MSTTEETAQRLPILLSVYAPRLQDVFKEQANHLGRKVMVTFVAVPGQDLCTVNVEFGIKESQVGRER